jgi:cell fate regulator YaaT (PSP1 superfamily)
MGACGLETRCCSQFLNSFKSISIRMAKTQGISLTPSDITGMCNRLRCCLSYEYCNYVEALKGLPKRNKRVNTPLGTGKVRDVAPLSGTIFVKLDELGMKEFNIDEIELISQTQDKINSKGKISQESQTTSQPSNKKNFQNRRKRNSNQNKSTGK